MKYLLDSNILIALGLNLNAGLTARAGECDDGDLVTSAVAFGEVLRGSRNGKPPKVESLAIMAEEIPVLPFDRRASEAYARIPFMRASYDRLIAAHALSLGLTVVTSNEKHFADVPGLVVENWTE